MVLEKHSLVLPPFLSYVFTLPGFFWVTRLMVQSFPKTPGDLLQVCQHPRIFAGGWQCLWWDFLHPQSWDLLGFIFKYFFLLVVPASLWGQWVVKLPAPALVALKGCCFIYWLPDFVRMVPYHGSQGETETEKPTATAPLIKSQTRPNTAVEMANLDKPWVPALLEQYRTCDLLQLMTKLYFLGYNSNGGVIRGNCCWKICY